MLNPEKHTVNGTPHNLPMILDIKEAFTKLPKPDVNLYDYYLLDTKGKNEKNNGDGVVDAGEIIDLGVVLRNRWGMSKDTIVSIDTYSEAGIVNPFVEIITGSTSFDGVGTYSTKSNLIYDEDNIITGFDSPLTVKIKENCPNDYRIQLYVTITYKNGLDDKDTSTYVNEGVIEFLVRSGVVLPSQITEDSLNAMKSNKASRSFTVSKIEEEPVYPDVIVSIVGECKDNFEVYIKAPKETNLAAGDFTVTYDNTLLECISAEKVLESSMIIANIKNDESKAIFSFICENGISEDASLVKLTFKSLKPFEKVTISVTGKNLVNSTFKDVTVNYLPATSVMHKNMATEEAKAPTCLDIGWEAYTYCTNCGYNNRVEIPATGHMVIKVDKYITEAYELQNDTSYPFKLVDSIYSSTNKSNSSKSDFTIKALHSFTLKLKYSVSSEANYDKLIILKNGTALDTISGVVSNKEIPINLVANDIVTIQYQKDGSVNTNNDTGYFEILTENSIEVIDETFVSVDKVESNCKDSIICDVCGVIAKQATEHNYIVTEKVESTEETAGYEKYSCSECGEVIVEPVEVTVTMTPDYKIFGIQEMTLSLANNIAINYKTNIPSSYKNVYMVFVYEDSEYIVNEYSVSGAYYSFKFDETRPHKMASNVAAYIYGETEEGYTLDYILEYSIMKYCVNQLSRNPSAELKTVISDVLTYGAAVQRYVYGDKISEAELVTSMVEAKGYTLTPTAFPGIESGNQIKYDDVEPMTYYWTQVSLMLGSTTEMYFRFKAPSIDNGLKIKVEYSDQVVIYEADDIVSEGNGVYRISVDRLTSMQYVYDVKATFVVDDVELSSMTDSINSYLYRQVDKQSGYTQEVMKALYVYGQSVRGYFGK